MESAALNLTGSLLVDRLVVVCFLVYGPAEQYSCSGLLWCPVMYIHWTIYPALDGFSFSFLFFCHETKESHILVWQI